MWNQWAAEVRHQLWNHERESAPTAGEQAAREARCAELRRALAARGFEPVGARLDLARWPRSGVT